MIANERWLSHMKAAVTLSYDLDIPLARAFGRLIEACESARVRSRCRKGFGSGKDIPFDWWSHAEIGGYEIRFLDRTVTNYDEIEINEMDLARWIDEQRALTSSSAADFKQAPKALIREIIKAVYDDAEASGRKPPNIKELPSSVLPRLHVMGLRASKRQISDVGGAREFGARRWRTGQKTSRARARAK